MNRHQIYPAGSIFFSNGTVKTLQKDPAFVVFNDYILAFSHGPEISLIVHLEPRHMLYEIRPSRTPYPLTPDQAERGRGMIAEILLTGAPIEPFLDFLIDIDERLRDPIMQVVNS